MNNSTIQKNIMRRVYYTYMVSIALHSMLWRGIFLSVTAGFLAQWLHISSIVHNFLSIPVGNVPQYITNSLLYAATHGEMIMLLTLLSAGIVGLSCLYQILQSVRIERLFAQTA
jgi:hypothetical protein